MRKMYFLPFCLRLWRQSVNSIPTSRCVCVCAHAHAPTHCTCHNWSVWSHPRWSISFHGSSGSSARLFFSLQHQWGCDKKHIVKLQLLLTMLDRPGQHQRCCTCLQWEATRKHGILQQSRSLSLSVCLSLFVFEVPWEPFSRFASHLAGILTQTQGCV